MRTIDRQKGWLMVCFQMWSILWYALATTQAGRQHAMMERGGEQGKEGRWNRARQPKPTTPNRHPSFPSTRAK